MSNWKAMLRKKLQEKRISARKLAQLSVLSTSTVHDMLNKEGFSPQIDSLQKVFAQLDCTIIFVDDASEELLRAWIKENKLHKLTFNDIEGIYALSEKLGMDSCLELLGKKPVSIGRVHKILTALR